MDFSLPINRKLKKHELNCVNGVRKQFRCRDEKMTIQISLSQRSMISKKFREWLSKFDELQIEIKEAE